MTLLFIISVYVDFGIAYGLTKMGAYCAQNCISTQQQTIPALKNLDIRTCF